MSVLRRICIRFCSGIKKTAKCDFRIKVFARNVNEFVKWKTEKGRRFFGIQWIEVNKIENVVVSIVDEPAASEEYAFFKAANAIAYDECAMRAFFLGICDKLIT